MVLRAPSERADDPLPSRCGKVLRDRRIGTKGLPPEQTFDIQAPISKCCKRGHRDVISSRGYLAISQMSPPPNQIPADNRERWPDSSRYLYVMHSNRRSPD